MKNIFYIAFLLAIPFSSNAGLFCSNEELPCDLSDTPQYDSSQKPTEEKITFSMRAEGKNNIKVLESSVDIYNAGTGASASCKIDRRDTEGKYSAIFMENFISNYNKKHTDIVAELDQCKIDSFEIVSYPPVNSMSDFLAKYHCPESLTSAVQGKITCTLKKYKKLTKKEVIGAQCSRLIECGSQLKSTKQLELFEKMKATICTTTDIENSKSSAIIQDGPRSAKDSIPGNQKDIQTTNSTTVSK